ncbi:MAG: PorV/PorQ family protein, partial [Bacteroidota bacterium]|nr:PorV/PorQ family protein [Bacteroidota bacterium]
MRKIFLILFIFCFNDSYSQVSILRGQDTTRRPIITAVPFLLISPDSRGSAMGETGVATSPDANSVHWNNAKLAFIDKKYGFGLSYVPWLGKIVDDMSISYLSGFYKIDKVQTVGLSVKYFDLGEIQLTDNQGLSLGIENPKELSTAFTYSRKLTNNLSLGGTARYIWSNLTGSISNYSDAKAGNSFS